MSDKSDKVTCPHCGKEVTPVVKMFNTKICPSCNIIISSNKGIWQAVS